MQLTAIVLIYIVLFVLTYGYGWVNGVEHEKKQRGEDFHNGRF